MLVTQAFGAFSWITLGPPVAATELKKIDQNGPARRTQAGRSEAFIDELRARRHGPNANPPAWRSSNF
ncbi:hypothetical protein BSU04_08445 [Caballeronia sordidicola]|uniref:Uncharacterized protein n=1 Tax=Caballeronia sordidicola TaxID=196367 RepID=A0A226X7T9_CABSO|nr:hypothetical protein BSU04_08445 [Caballeronia sordidicola]